MSLSSDDAIYATGNANRKSAGAIGSGLLKDTISKSASFTSINSTKTNTITSTLYNTASGSAHSSPRVSMISLPSSSNNNQFSSNPTEPVDSVYTQFSDSIWSTGSSRSKQAIGNHLGLQNSYSKYSSSSPALLSSPSSTIHTNNSTIHNNGNTDYIDGITKNSAEIPISNFSSSPGIFSSPSFSNSPSLIASSLSIGSSTGAPNSLNPTLTHIDSQPTDDWIGGRSNSLNRTSAPTLLFPSKAISPAQYQQSSQSVGHPVSSLVDPSSPSLTPDTIEHAYQISQSPDQVQQSLAGLQSLQFGQPYRSSGHQYHNEAANGFLTNAHPVGSPSQSLGPISNTHSFSPLSNASSKPSSANQNASSFGPYQRGSHSSPTLLISHSNKSIGSPSLVSRQLNHDNSRRDGHHDLYDDDDDADQETQMDRHGSALADLLFKNDNEPNLKSSQSSIHSIPYTVSEMPTIHSSASQNNNNKDTHPTNDGLNMLSPPAGRRRTNSVPSKENGYGSVRTSTTESISKSDNLIYGSQESDSHLKKSILFDNEEISTSTKQITAPIPVSYSKSSTETSPPTSRSIRRSARSSPVMSTIQTDGSNGNFSSSDNSRQAGANTTQNQPTNQSNPSSHNDSSQQNSNQSSSSLINSSIPMGSSNASASSIVVSGLSTTTIGSTSSSSSNSTNASWTSNAGSNSSGSTSSGRSSTNSNPSISSSNFIKGEWRPLRDVPSMKLFQKYNRKSGGGSSSSSSLLAGSTFGSSPALASSLSNQLLSNTVSNEPFSDDFEAPNSNLPNQANQCFSVVLHEKLLTLASKIEVEEWGPDLNILAQYLDYTFRRAAELSSTQNTILGFFPEGSNDPIRCCFHTGLLSAKDVSFLYAVFTVNTRGQNTSTKSQEPSSIGSSSTQPEINPSSQSHPQLLFNNSSITSNYNNSSHSNASSSLSLNSGLSFANPASTSDSILNQERTESSSSIDSKMSTESSDSYVAAKGSYRGRLQNHSRDSLGPTSKNGANSSTSVAANSSSSSSHSSASIAAHSSHSSSSSSTHSLVNPSQGFGSNPTNLMASYPSIASIAGSPQSKSTGSLNIFQSSNSNPSSFYLNSNNYHIQSTSNEPYWFLSSFQNSSTMLNTYKMHNYQHTPPIPKSLLPAKVTYWTNDPSEMFFDPRLHIEESIDYAHLVGEPGDKEKRNRLPQKYRQMSYAELQGRFVAGFEKSKIKAEAAPRSIVPQFFWDKLNNEGRGEIQLLMPISLDYDTNKPDCAAVLRLEGRKVNSNTQIQQAHSSGQSSNSANIQSTPNGEAIGSNILPAHSTGSSFSTEQHGPGSPPLSISPPVESHIQQQIQHHSNISPQSLIHQSPKDRFYRVITLLSLEHAYINSRLIQKVDQFWLWPGANPSHQPHGSTSAISSLAHSQVSLGSSVSSLSSKKNSVSSLPAFQSSPSLSNPHSRGNQSTDSLDYLSASYDNGEILALKGAAPTSAPNLTSKNPGMPTSHTQAANQSHSYPTSSESDNEHSDVEEPEPISSPPQNQASRSTSNTQATGAKTRRPIKSISTPNPSLNDTLNPDARASRLPSIPEASPLIQRKATESSAATNEEPKQSESNTNTMKQSPIEQKPSIPPKEESAAASVASVRPQQTDEASQRATPAQRSNRPSLQGQASSGYIHPSPQPAYIPNAMGTYPDMVSYYPPAMYDPYTGTPAHLSYGPQIGVHEIPAYMVQDHPMMIPPPAIGHVNSPSASRMYYNGTYGELEHGIPAGLSLPPASYYPPEADSEEVGAPMPYYPTSKPNRLHPNQFGAPLTNQLNSYPYGNPYTPAGARYNQQHPVAPAGQQYHHYQMQGQGQRHTNARSVSPSNNPNNSHHKETPQANRPVRQPPKVEDFSDTGFREIIMILKRWNQTGSNEPIELARIAPFLKEMLPKLKEGKGLCKAYILQAKEAGIVEVTPQRKQNYITLTEKAMAEPVPALPTLSNFPS